MATNELITIAYFTDAIEANIIKGRLAAEGVRVNIADQHYITMNWFLSNALGGVKLQVFQDDVPKAKRILKDLQQGEYEIKEDDNTNKILCPHCGSDRVKHLKPNTGFILMMLYFFNLPIPYSSRKYQCLDCKKIVIPIE